MECLALEFANIIKRHHGTDVAVAFQTRFFTANPGFETLAGIPEAVQVRMMNAFWRNVLNLYADTLAIRAWLNDHLSARILLMDFENHWMGKVVQRGLI